MRRSIEVGLKRLLPTRISRGLRMAENFRKRVFVWRSIAREMKGCGPADRQALRRSAIAAPFLSFGKLYAWKDPVLLRDAEVDVAGVGRFRVRARTDDLYHVLPSREPEIFAALREHLKPGATFVDAGANIGVFSVYAASLVGSNGSVIAVEMMPDTAAILRQHLEKNGVDQATVIERALSDRAGLRLEATVMEGHFGMASIVAEHGHGARRIWVETTTLDEVLSGVERVALMKMDLEGAEMRALLGAGEALRKIDAIAFEQLSGETAAGSFLSGAGFDIRQLRGSNFLASRRAASWTG